MYSGNAFKLLKTNVQREKSMEIDCWPQIWQLREATTVDAFSGFREVSDLYMKNSNKNYH